MHCRGCIGPYASALGGWFTSTGTLSGVIDANQVALGACSPPTGAL